MQVKRKRKKKYLTPDDERHKFTPPMIARRWGVSAEKVQEFVRSGELPAINIAAAGCTRPRYLIDVEDLKAFEAGRAVQPPPPRKRRRKPTADVQEFY